MRLSMNALWRDERGQDLIEYALVTAFAAAAAPAIWGSAYMSKLAQVLLKVAEILDLSMS